MNDSEFIELLNLYLDHEITAEQSARLESEVAASPQRRKVYQEYCMLAKGCSLLGSAYAEQAPERPLAEAPSRAELRSFWGWSGGFYGAGLQAAACLVAVFVVRVRHGAQPLAGSPAVAVAAQAPMHVTTPARANASLSAQDQMVLLTMRQPTAVLPETLSGTPELHTVFSTRPWINAAPAVAQQSDQAFAWMNDVNLKPMQQLKLQALPMLAIPTTAPQSFGSQEQIQLIGYQFQR
jgi:hypothetical protein